MYKILYKKEEIVELATYLLNFPVVCYDLETTGLETHAKIFETVGMGFCVKEGEAYYIPFNYNHGLSEQEIYDLFKEVLENPNIGKVGQNIKYDARVSRRYNVDVKPIVWDTQVANYCLYSDRIGHGIDDQALHYFNVVKTRTKSLIPKKKAKSEYIPTMKDAPIEDVGNYCMEDCDMCFRIYKLQKKLMDLPVNAAAKKIYLEIDLPLVSILVGMECNGIALDLEYHSVFKGMIQKRIERYKSYLTKALGRELSITNPQDIANAIYAENKIDEQLGIEIPLTATGKKSTSAATLAKLSSKSNIVSAIESVKKYEKLMGTFIAPMVDYIGYDGYIHPSFNQCATSTGRLACNSPNVQQFPGAKSGTAKKIRKIFVSRWKDIGGKILAADMSQAELRILAHKSGEEALIEAFRTGKNIHTAVMDRINTVLEGAGVAKRLNKAETKVLNFGMIYQMGPKKLSEQTGMSVEVAEDLIKSYLGSMPKVAEYINSCNHSLSRKGYTESLFGRRRYIPKIFSEDKGEAFAAQREAGNHPIQGTNADMIKKSMRFCAENLLKTRLRSLLIMQVHDELVFDVYPGEEDVLKELVVKDMKESASCLIVPMDIGAELGVSWEDAH